jgi:hypothetical protein
MLPILLALMSRSFSSWFVRAVNSAIFLSCSAFLTRSSEASPLAFLMAPISFWRALTARRSLSIS